MQSAEHDVTLQMPPRGRRRPPPWPTIALAVAAAVAVVSLGSVLLTGDGENVRSERLPATSTTVAATPTTAAEVPPAPATTVAAGPPSTAAPATTAAPRRLADSRVSLDGIGPVDIGMTLEEASRAAGTPIRLVGPGLGDCAYARADVGPGGLMFMVISGRIERVDVGPGPVRTVSGVGVGSTEADVQRTYPGRIRVEDHPYVPTGHYLVYTPADPSLAHLSMIFETDGDRVTSFRAGLRGAVAQIEGCS